MALLQPCFVFNPGEEDPFHFNADVSCPHLGCVCVHVFFPPVFLLLSLTLSWPHKTAHFDVLIHMAA